MVSSLPLSVQLAWLIPLYGFAGVGMSLPWACGWIRRTGPRPAAYLNVLVTLVAFLHGTALLNAVLQHGAYEISLGWFQAADLKLELSFDLSLTNLACLELVAGLSLLAQVFALGYLDKEWSLARFFALVGFFEAAMAGVVLSSSLFLTYFLLEMLTLSTYLLVGFWYGQPLVVTAARDAFLTKRVGDVLLLMGVVALSAFAGVMRFEDLYRWVPQAQLSPLAANLLGLALIAGPLGKCAQFPMHLWLDEAMEGPNPASILRNSVVVTCGALVLLRLMPILQLSPISLDVLIVLGSLTAIGGSLAALAQVDIKRALSYTTSAAMGLVFIAIAEQQPAIALLLLFAHAVAKALLFMSVGSVIATTNCQDLSELGGLARCMPATTVAFLVGAAGSTALAPLGCFWAYGLDVEAMARSSPALAMVVLLANTLTLINFSRVFRCVFLGPRQTKTRRAPEVNWQMALPMVSLTVLVLLTPLIMVEIDPVPGLASFPPQVAWALVASGATGLILGGTVPLYKGWSRSTLKPLRQLQDLLAFDFYTERIYRRTVVALVATLARLAAWFDRQVVNGLVEQLASLSMASAAGLKLTVGGQMQTYVLTAMASIVVLLGSLSWVMR
ncbi:MULTISPECIES: NAD(P)H-quinone oxidoreductase subunit F [unclassified Synechococcus]|uniref:NAD(P)H-quinone oxidoreductase subunit F n=1 Tax=unclassified Synechococcus TaxID=2626047 RepID=UPI0021A3E8B4|nr:MULTISPECIES: NAD(P)H-quinone oxidoreductase subunit F [unclassified Synechococcus]MCT0213069.1 NAD(P)H-quinone oxidoreductase subunit F [Synechococcus sp. CS-1326]MCT0232314.1 NAD(P)H-quinone oxidoreductase subunit F [Synechococcus sp. CS-1327]